MNLRWLLWLLAWVLVGCGGLPPSHPAKSDRSPAEREIVTDCSAMIDADRATLVIAEPATGRSWVCQSERAQQRFVPASTYKIPHTLIALETGAVDATTTSFVWDGRDRGVAVWNRDLSLADAVKVSGVWVFQDLAARVGTDLESAWTRRLAYGNAHVGAHLDLRHFWLSGPLTISAREQVDFLMRLREGGLPVSEASRSQTIAALRLGNTVEGYAIHGKTGAMLPIDDEGFLRLNDATLLPADSERTGWFVGWIERSAEEGGPIYFAHNLDLSLPKAMAARTAAAYAVLRANGLPAPE